MRLDRAVLVRNSRKIVDIMILLSVSLWFDAIGPIVALRLATASELWESFPTRELATLFPMIRPAINAVTFTGLASASVNYVTNTVKYRLPIAMLMVLLGNLYISLFYLALALSGGLQLMVYGTMFKIYVLSQAPVTQHIDVMAMLMQLMPNIPIHMPAPQQAPVNYQNLVHPGPVEEITLDLINHGDGNDMISHQPYNVGDEVYIINNDVRHIIRREHAGDLFVIGGGLNPLTREQITSLRSGIIAIVTNSSNDNNVNNDDASSVSLSVEAPEADNVPIEAQAQPQVPETQSSVEQAQAQELEPEVQ